MDYTIRIIRPEDDQTLAHIIKSTLEEIGCAMDGTVYTDPNTDRMHSCYQDERTVYYIALSEGEMLGGAGIAPVPNQTENYCELQRMFLTSKARGKGIGAALMQKCLDFARKAAYDLVYIETFEEMQAARKLYEKSGFKYVDYQLGNTGHFSCGVKMILPLK